MIYPVPKPRKKVRRPTGRPRIRLKNRNARRKGRAFGASRVDETYLDWIRSKPCAVHLAMGWEQRTPTEAEHFVSKAHGGFDRGDTYPGCGECREMRHGTMGPKAFTRMLQAQGFDDGKLCDKLAKLYEVARWPCP